MNDNKKIFHSIDDYLVKVYSSIGACTGFFLTNSHKVGVNKNLICIPAHVLNKPFVNEPGTNVAFEHLECVYQGVSYFAKVIRCFYCYDSAICQIIAEEDDILISSSPINIFKHVNAPVGGVEPGDQVYYGGFPFTRENPTFHIGTVSSVEFSLSAEALWTFTVDGSILAGLSGSPVFVVRDGALSLVGVISSVLSDFDFEDRKFIAIMKAQQEHIDVVVKEREKVPAFMSGIQIGGAAFGEVTTHTIHYTRNNVPETFLYNDQSAMSRVLDIIQRNHTSGIGKILHSKHILALLADCAIPSEAGISLDSSLVTHKEGLPGMLSMDPVYLEWFHRVVKQNPSKCLQYIGRILGAADKITKQEELRLRPQYESFDYKGFTEDSSHKWEVLKKKIMSAKPKALKSNRNVWITALNGFLNDQALVDQRETISEMLLKLQAEAAGGILNNQNSSATVMSNKLF